MVILRFHPKWGKCDALSMEQTFYSLPARDDFDISGHLLIHVTYANSLVPIKRRVWPWAKTFYATLYGIPDRNFYDSKNLRGSKSKTINQRAKSYNVKDEQVNACFCFDDGLFKTNDVSSIENGYVVRSNERGKNALLLRKIRYNITVWNHPGTLVIFGPIIVE